MGRHDVARKTGFGKARPVQPGWPLGDMGDLGDGRILAQKGNSCGTCSLSAVFRHYGIETTQAELDREMRNFNIFGAPGLVVRTARGRGFEAAFHNRGTLAEVIELIDRGIPVLLIVDTQPGNILKPLHLHYVVAIAHRALDGETRLGVYNPWGLREEITGEELEFAWGQVHVGPLVAWDHAFITVAPSGAGLGRGRPAGARGVNMCARSFANVANGLAHAVRGGLLSEGLKELAVSVPEAVAGLGLLAIDLIRKARRRAA